MEFDSSALGAALSLAVSYFGFTFTHGLTFEIELVGVVHQSIENGVGQGRIAEVLMPVRHWQLTGDQGRTDIETVIQDLQQIALVFIGERGHTQIVQDDQIGLGQLGQQLVIPAVALGDGEFLT